MASSSSEAEFLEEWRAHGSPRVVVGVDGGGTSTECAILPLSLFQGRQVEEDTEGRGGSQGAEENPLEGIPERERVVRGVLGRGRRGASNRNSVGDEKARDALQESVKAALAQARVPRGAVHAVAACMAGVDRPGDVETVSAWVREWFPEPVVVSVHNDALAQLASGTLGRIPGLTDTATSTDQQPTASGCGAVDESIGSGAGSGAEARAGAGATDRPSLDQERAVSGCGIEAEAIFRDPVCRDQATVVVIAGTGSIVYGIAKDGRTARASGAGPLLGDRGSGYAIASEALGAVMRAADGRGPPTSLTQAILERLSLHEPSDLIGWIYSDLAWARVAALLPVVKRCAAEGDPVAERIVAESVEELAQGIRAVAVQLGVCSPGETSSSGGGRACTVIAAGGVLEDRSAPDMFALLSKRLLSVVPQATLKLPQVDAAVGAALLALRMST